VELREKQGSSRSLQSFLSEDSEYAFDVFGEDIKENKEKTESRAQGSTSPSAAAAEKKLREPKRRPSTELRSTKQRYSSFRELKQELKPKELTRYLYAGSLVTGKLDCYCHQKTCYCQATQYCVEAETYFLKKRKHIIFLLF
jgi:hypothetical protein